MKKLEVVFIDGLDSLYRTYLIETINRVLSKIGENSDDIKWIVFKKNNISDPLFCDNYFKNYGDKYFTHKFKDGFCVIASKEVWISTHAINQSLNMNLLLTPSIKPFINKESDDLLVNVILDELAHLKTKQNHGNSKYDMLLNTYHNKYYNANSYLSNFCISNLNLGNKMFTLQ